MKKFWNLIVALAVIMGVSSCSDSDVDGSISNNFSFVATIEHTRADMVNSDGTWQTIWSGDDKLYVTSDKGDFTFANSTKEPHRFVSTDAEASVLRDATNIVITTLHENGSVVDSDAGKRGLSLSMDYERFPKSGEVSLAVRSSFFRLACDYDVTLLADAAIFSGINGSNTLEKSVTLKAGSDIWVAFMPCVEKISLSAIVADKTEVSFKDVVLEPCVIYGIGEILPNTTPEPEPEPEPEGKVVYLVPNDDWKSDNAWFAAYLWEGDQNTSVVLTDDNGDGVYKAVIPKNMSNIIFCRMNPAYAEFAWNSNAESDRVWAKTANLIVGVVPYNYYYITGADRGEWNRAGYDPNPPVEERDTWAVSGTFNNWGDTLMSATSEYNIFVKQGLELKAGDKFKIKIAGSWNRNYGSDAMLMPNKWTKGYQDGPNIVVVRDGTYDIYLDSVEERVYLMGEGVDYTTATEYGVNDENQGPSSDFWGLCGTHNNWNNPDIELAWNVEVGLYVAYSAKLTGEFKVRSNNSWEVNYGCDGRVTVTVNADKGVPMIQGGDNCQVSSGTYDVYFDLEGAKIWVRTPGSTAPTK